MDKSFICFVIALLVTMSAMFVGLYEKDGSKELNKIAEKVYEKR